MGSSEPEPQELASPEPEPQKPEPQGLGEHLRIADPEVGLRAVGALHRLAERVEATHVAEARHAGWSWEQIGDALGVTRQSVHAKYGKREKDV